jgi:hypothetical protein
MRLRSSCINVVKLKKIVLSPANHIDGRIWKYFASHQEYFYKHKTYLLLSRLYNL